MAIKLKHIILYLGLWIFTTSSAYYFGTMKPNQKVLVDLTNKIASEIQKDYAQHKFFEPEVVYNNNETFMRAVNSCVEFVNLKKFEELKEELKIRIINISIKLIKGNYYNPRSKKVVNLIKKIVMVNGLLDLHHKFLRRNIRQEKKLTQIILYLILDNLL